MFEFNGCEISNYFLKVSNLFYIKKITLPKISRNVHNTCLTKRFYRTSSIYFLSASAPPGVCNLAAQRTHKAHDDSYSFGENISRNSTIAWRAALSLINPRMGLPRSMVVYTTMELIKVKPTMITHSL